MTRKCDGGILDRCFQLRYMLENPEYGSPDTNYYDDYSSIKADVAQWYPTRHPGRELSDAAVMLLLRALLADIERLMARLDEYP